MQLSFRLAYEVMNKSTKHPNFHTLRGVDREKLDAFVDFLDDHQHCLRFLSIRSDSNSIKSPRLNYLIRANLSNAFDESAAECAATGFCLCGGYQYHSIYYLPKGCYLAGCLSLSLPPGVDLYLVLNLRITVPLVDASARHSKTTDEKAPSKL